MKKFSSLVHSIKQRQPGPDTINWNVKQRDTYLEFCSSEEAQQWGEKYYSTWATYYHYTMDSVKERKRGVSTYPVEYYCGNGYTHVNKYLRGESVSYCGQKDAETIATVLPIVLCSAPRIPENIVVYRAVPNSFVTRMKEDNKKRLPLQEKGFLSTSMTKEIVKNSEFSYYGDYLLKIFIPKEAVGIYVNSVTRRTENEILLMSGCYLGMASHPFYDASVNKQIIECLLL